MDKNFFEAALEFAHKHNLKIASECGVCGHAWGEHYTTNAGDYVGCSHDDSCQGFAISENPSGVEAS